MLFFVVDKVGIFRTLSHVAADGGPLMFLVDVFHKSGEMRGVLRIERVRGKCAE